MDKMGIRLIHDQDGEILASFSEMEGDITPRKELTSIGYVDLEYGSIDFSKYKLVGVDVQTQQPILEERQLRESPEQAAIRLQKRVDELETYISDTHETLGRDVP